MKFRTINQFVLAAVATLGVATASFALDTVSHQRQTDALGVPAPKQVASRVIQLDSGARYLNVDRGETVTVMKDGREFTWHFNTLGAPIFDLAKIAPQDFPAGRVTVYVSPSAADLSAN